MFEKNLFSAGSIVGILLMLFIAFMLSGCASVLPTETTSAKYPWLTFDEVKTAYNSIEIDKTDVNGLEKQGFDPQNTANVTILNYMDVANRFSPILDKKDLPEGVQTCIKVQDKCTAYFAAPTRMSRERIGNVAMDLLGFRKETKTTGWKFEAVFVIVDGKVIYKLWGGTPEIEEYAMSKKPLGPLQGSLGSMFAP